MKIENRKSRIDFVGKLRSLSKKLDKSARNLFVFLREMWVQGHGVVILLILLILSKNSLFALPQDATVVSGNVNINTSGAQMQITAPGNTIINWNGYSIGQGELVQYLQNGGTSLNRVTGGSISELLGTLKADGKVWIINPNGVLIGNGAVIDTAGFAASTLNITDANFLAGHYLFEGTPQDASIVNYGSILTNGGDVHLFAPTIKNYGEIKATNGNVNMVSAEKLLLAVDGGISVEVPAQTTQEGIVNQGTIEGVNVALRTSGSHYSLAINNGGLISANTVINQNGRVFLKADSGVVNNSGVITVSSLDSTPGFVELMGDSVVHSGTITAAGGAVHILGEETLLTGSAVVDVSDLHGGGEILIGGDYQGSNPAIQNAQYSTVEQGAQLKADATESGDGGKIIIWSDKTTQFHGHISARGAGETGKGGFAEVSGKEHLIITGYADLMGGTDAYESFGTLLLDPGTVTIQDGSGSNTGPDLIDDAYVITQLGSGNFVIATIFASSGNEDIIIQGAVNVTWSANTTLTLNAGRLIDMQSGAVIENTSTTHTGDAIVFDANVGGAATGDDTDAITIDGATVRSNTGDIKLYGQAKGNAGMSNYGIKLLNGGQVISNGTGASAATITLVGTGGNGTWVDYGIYIAGANSKVSSTDGNIAITGQGGAGSGSSDTGIVLFNGAQVISTGTATISIVGTGNGSTYLNIGVFMDGNGGSSTYITSVSGAINITGAGGASATGTSNHGVYINDGAYVSSTSTNDASAASITITGTGGGGTTNNYGVYVSGTNSKVTSNYGNISVTGKGGGSTSSNYGTYLYNGGQITSTGTSTGAATISVTGTGYSGTSDNGGVRVESSGSKISTIDGAITVNGRGGDGSSAANYGMVVYNSGVIESLGTSGSAGTITINGTGGTSTNRSYGTWLLTSGQVNSNTGNISITGQSSASATGTANHGVRLEGGSQVQSSSGASIILVGTAGGGTSSDGIHTETGSNIIGGGSDTGNITLTADTMELLNVSIESDGQLLVQSATTSNTMGLGTSAAGTLQLSDTELGNITTGFSQIYFGRSDSAGDVDIHNNALATLLGGSPVTVRTPGSGGDITVDSTATAISWSSAKKFELEAGRTITVNSSALIDSTNTAFGAGDAIVFKANYGGAATGDDTDAITISSGATVRSNTGDIKMYGQAKGSAGASNYGIFVGSAGEIASSGTGADAATISLYGTGGSGTDTNYGVMLNQGIVSSKEGAILINAQGGSGSGTQNTGFYMNGTSEVKSTNAGANAADITITGTAGTGTTNQIGVFIVGPGKISTIDGDITITGKGGDVASSSNMGVYLYTGGQVVSTGTTAGLGSITINGTGGNGTDSNYGTFITGTDSKVTSNFANIIIRGQGGTAATGGSNYGIAIENAGQVTSTGTGASAADISLYGTGGSGTNFNYGTLVSGSSALVQTIDGTITITGKGGTSTGVQAIGAFVYNGGQVVSLGTSANAGVINITGTGGTSATGNNQGVYVDGSANTGLITSNMAAINITGQGGSSTSGSNVGVNINAKGQVISYGTGASVGTITIIGTGGDGTGNSHGVLVGGATGLVTSIDGDISLTGQSAAGDWAYGVLVSDGGQVTSTGTNATAGAITVLGTGGSAGTGHMGVVVTASNSKITSSRGNISVTGKGGDSGTINYGIWVNTGGQITSTGAAGSAGTITIVGTGGNGTASNKGVYIAGASALVTSLDGAISITGQGQGTTTTNRGIDIQSDGKVTSTVSATITLTGTGGNGTDWNNGIYINGNGGGSYVSSVTGAITMSGAGGATATGNYNTGVNITNTGSVASTGAATISITGTAGGGSNTSGIYSDTGSNVIGGASDTGNITLTSDTMELLNISIRSTGQLLVQSATTSNTMGLGTSAAGTLQLSDTELGNIYPGFSQIYFGRTDSAGDVDIHNNALATLLGGSPVTVRTPGSGGDITVDSTATAISWSSAKKFELEAGRSITLNSSALIDNTNTAFGAGDAIVFKANYGGTATGDSTDAILISGATVRSNTGDIKMYGQAKGSGTDSNYGIEIQSGGKIISSGTGADAATITLNGTGGSGASANFGVYIQGTNTQVTTIDGDVDIVGVGGAGSTTWQVGTYLYNGGQIISTGTSADAGVINITGTGGAGTSNNEGVRINGNGASTTYVTSTRGGITISGRGYGSTTANYGVHVYNGGQVSSTGIGAAGTVATIAITGTGASGTSSNYGVLIEDTGSVTTKVTSVDGTISITGQGGAQSGDYSIGTFIYNGAQVTSTGTDANASDITIIGTGGNAANYNDGVRMSTGSARITTIDGNVTVTGKGGNGSGANSQGVYILSPAYIQSTGTTSGLGAISVTGTGGNGTYYNHGVSLSGASGYITSAAGNVSINGAGGASATGTSNYGVYIYNSAQIRSIGTGDDSATITVVGTGGSGTGNDHGLYISGVNSCINSIDGDMNITGKGGASVSGNWSYGIYLNSSGSINSTGTGDNASNITVAGTGGTTWYSDGIYINNNAGMSTIMGDISITVQAGDAVRAIGLGTDSGGAWITSTGTGAGAGNITIVGTGGNSTERNTGLIIYNNNSYVSTIDGNISITGQGQGTGTQSYGIWLWNSGSILSTGSGAITLTGTGSPNGSDSPEGIYTSTGSNIIGGGSDTGNITLTADTMELLDVDIQSTGQLLIQSATTSNTMGLGTSAAGTLQLSDTELGNITTGFSQIYFGRSDSAGDIDIHGNALATTLGDPVTVRTPGSTGDILFDATCTGITWSGANKFEVIAGRQITLSSGVVIDSTSTGFSGAQQSIALKANEGGVSTGDNTQAILMNNSTVRSSTGDIYIVGQAKSDGGAGDCYGVYLYGGTDIISNGTGAEAASITILGTGGGSTVWNYDGVRFTDSGTTISTIDGDISITGQGGGAAGATTNIGIRILNGAQITSTGTNAGAGTISLVGTGGTGSNSNDGIYIDGNAGANTYITSNVGAISLTGQAGSASTGIANIGVYFYNGAYVGSTNTSDTNAASITIVGTGGGGTASNHGVGIAYSNAKVTSNYGDISITGKGGSGSTDSNRGIWIYNTGQVTSTGTGAGAATITLLGTGGTGTANIQGIDVEASSFVTSIDGAISVTGQGGTGATGSANIGVYLADSGYISSTGTNDANAASITIVGTGGGGTSSLYGVYLLTNSYVTSVAGNISITGKGGSGSGTTNDGLVIDASQVTSTGTTGAATITLVGTGGTGTQYNRGFELLTASTIQSGYGNISITGVGGSGSTDRNQGMQLYGSSSIISTGVGDSAANITIIGTGGTGTDYNVGINASTGTSITTIDGDILLQGYGAGTGASSRGVQLTTGGAATQITSTGTTANAGTITIIGTGGSGAYGSQGILMTGNGTSSTYVTSEAGAISMTGQGGTAATGTANHGVYVYNSSSVNSTGSATVTIAGTAGGGTSSYGIASDTGSNVIGGASDTGNITLTSDTMGLADLSVQSVGGQLLVQGAQAATTMGLGGGAGTLNLADTELDCFTNGFSMIYFGRTDSTGLITADAYTFSDNVTLRNPGGGSGGISITGALSVGANNLTLNTVGTASQTAAITASGLELLGAGGTHTLTNSGNAITTLAGNTGTVSVRDDSGFDIGTVNSTVGLTTSGNATLTSAGGTVTQSQAVTASGLELLGVGGTYTLTNSGNAITTLAGNTGAVSLREDSGFAIGTVNTTGLTASGNVTFNTVGGTVTQSQLLSASGLELLGAGGTYTLTNSGNAITTLAGNTGTLSLREDSGFAIGTVNTIGFTSSGNTTFNTVGGTVTQSQLLSASGLELLGAGGTYTLTNSGNNITTLAGNTGTVSMRDDSGFVVGTVNTVGLTTSGNATFNTVGGTVTQSQAVSASGLELLGAGGTYTLTNSGNAITTLAGNTGAVSLREDSGFAIGTVNTTGLTASGNVTLNSVGGTVTQSQLLAASGLELLGAGGTYTLTNSGNAITTLAGNTGTVSFRDDSGFDIGSVNTVGLTATGDATLRSEGGIVTQSQAISAVGLAVRGDGGTFTLTNASNAVTNFASRTGTTSFRDDSGFAIGTAGGVTGIDNTGAVTLTSGGAVTQDATAALYATTLDLQGAGGSYALNTIGGSITTLTGNTGSINYTNTGALNLGATTTTGAYTVTNYGGNLTGTGTLNITGAATLSAAGKTIDLSNANHGITALTLTAEDAHVHTSGALALAASTLGDDLDITAGGDITDSGNLIVNGDLSLTAAGNDIIFDQTGNRFGTVSLSAATATITEADSTMLHNITLTYDDGLESTGELNVYSIGGNIEDTTTGTSNITGTAILVAGGTSGNVSGDTAGIHDIILNDGHFTAGKTRVYAYNVLYVTGTVTFGDSEVGNDTIVIASGDILDASTIRIGRDLWMEGNNIFLDGTWIVGRNTHLFSRGAIQFPNYEDILFKQTLSTSQFTSQVQSAKLESQSFDQETTSPNRIPVTGDDLSSVDGMIENDYNKEPEKKRRRVIE